MKKLRRRICSWCPRAIGMVLLAAVIGFPLQQAESGTTEYELFFPTTVPEGGFLSESPKLMEELWSVGAYMFLEKNPVAINTSHYQNDGAVLQRWQVRGVFAYKLLDLVQLGLDFPLTLYAKQAFSGSPEVIAPNVNDMSLRVRYSFYQGGALNLGVSGFVLLPTGNEEKYAGTNGRLFQPGLSLLGECDLGLWYLRGNLGYAERDYTYVEEYGLEIEDQVLYRLSAGIRMMGNTIFAEYDGSYQIGQPNYDYTHDAKEVYIGIQRPFGDIYVSPGFAMGVGPGFSENPPPYGSPTWRIICSVFYMPHPEEVVEAVVEEPPPPPPPSPPKIVASVINFKTKEPVAAGQVYIKELNLTEDFTDGKWEKVFEEPGSYRLAFTAEEFNPYSETLNLEVGDVQSITVHLMPVSKEVEVAEKEVYINQKILFEFNKAEIKKESHGILDQVAELLIDHPELSKLLIKGHTDNVGGHAYNVRLSEDRARSVRQYLVKKGVEPERLESKGYGPDEPIADNSTPEGQEKNRRVEFEIMELGG